MRHLVPFIALVAFTGCVNPLCCDCGPPPAGDECNNIRCVFVEDAERSCQWREQLEDDGSLLCGDEGLQLADIACPCGAFDLSDGCYWQTLRGDIVLERMACITELRVTELNQGSRLIVREMPDLETIVAVPGSCEECSASTVFYDELVIEDNPALTSIEGRLFGSEMMTIRNNPRLSSEGLEGGFCDRCECGNLDQPPCPELDGGAASDGGGLDGGP